MIGPIRSNAFNQRLIREFFKERDIYLVNGSDIAEELADQLEILEVFAPELRAYH